MPSVNSFEGPGGAEGDGAEGDILNFFTYSNISLT